MTLNCWLTDVFKETTSHQWITFTWYRTMMFSRLLVSTSCWTNSPVGGDLRCPDAYVTSPSSPAPSPWYTFFETKSENNPEIYFLNGMPWIKTICVMMVQFKWSVNLTHNFNVFYKPSTDISPGRIWHGSYRKKTSLHQKTFMDTRGPSQ